MKTIYEATSPVKHNGKRYKAGEKIEDITKEQGEALVKVKAAKQVEVTEQTPDLGPDLAPDLAPEPAKKKSSSKKKAAAKQSE